MASHIYNLSRKSISSIKNSRDELKSAFTEKISPKIEKYLLTAIMCYTMLTYGILCTTLSPTLVDLKFIFNVTLDKVSIFYTINSIGYVCGSLYGFIFKYINRQITLIFLIALMGTSFGFIPQSLSIYVYYFFAFLIGMCGGAWDCGQFVWFIELWKDKSGAILQFSQFMFGVGTIIGPIIDRPFVTGQLNNFNSTDLFKANGTAPVEVNRKSLLTTPFAVTGLLHALGAVFMAILVLFKRYKNLAETNQENINMSQNEESNQIVTINQELQVKNTESNQLESRKKFFIILGAICLSTFSAVESGFFQFSPTFSQFLPLKLSAPEAAIILSVMTTAYTISRGLGFFIILKFQPQNIITVNYFIIFVGYFLLLFCGSSRTLLFVVNIILGIGFSSFWPLFFSFISKFITVTDRVGTVMIFAVGGTLAIMPLFMGNIIETDPLVLIYFSFITLIISFVAFIIIMKSARDYKRFLSDNQQPGNLNENLQRLSITSVNAAANYFRIKRLSVNTSNYYYDIKKSAERFEKF